MQWSIIKNYYLKVSFTSLALTTASMKITTTIITNILLRNNVIVIVIVTSTSSKALPGHLSKAGPHPASHLFLREPLSLSVFILVLCALAAEPGLREASQVSCVGSNLVFVENFDILLIMDFFFCINYDLFLKIALQYNLFLSLSFFGHPLKVCV